MKLSDCTAAMRADLDLERWDGYRGKHLHPTNGGVWFTYDSSAYEVDPICAACGHRDSRALSRDHCHVTGIYRGELCTSCNLAEGRDDGAMWPWWRRFAPGLTVGTRVVEAGQRNPLLDLEEIHTLPIDQLFDLAAERTVWFLAMEADPEHPGWAGYTASDRASHLALRPIVQLWGTLPYPQVAS